MIFDFNDFNFHIWIVVLLTFLIIAANLIFPQIKLSKILNKRVG
ncbi:MAG: hypothetical protein ACJ0BD_01285 [Gammaproteobacteria bacterium]